MDIMEDSSTAAAAHGDLADIVANATALSSSTAAIIPHPAAAAAHIISRSYDIPPAACAQIVLPNYDDDERPPHTMSTGGEALMLFDPYLHFDSSGSYGMQPTQQQQLVAPVQISSQLHSLVVDGDEATAIRRFSPPAAAQHHHQMMKRKSEVRKVVCIPAPPPPPPTSGRAGGGGEAVIPSDLWAWRKYGQKPIKGSPYPRGYYRCSSSKGCLARKQVERSRSDPNMLVITYTAEHNHPWPMHRNVLAGYARAHTSSTKKHKTTDISSSNNNTTTSHHHGGGYSVDDQYLQNADAMVVGGGQLTAEAGDEGADEVFAELEELLEEPDNSMVNNNAAADMCSNANGVSYQWHMHF